MLLAKIESIVRERRPSREKASAIWLNTVLGDRANHEIAFYLFERSGKRSGNGFYRSPEERFSELLSRSKRGDNAANREAIQILTDCLGT